MEGRNQRREKMSERAERRKTPLTMPRLLFFRVRVRKHYVT
jgi:hypothetical protein